MSSSAYEAIQTDAEALKPAEVKPYPGQLQRMKRNLLLGIEALEQHRPLLKSIYREHRPLGPTLMGLLNALTDLAADVARARPVTGTIRPMAKVVYADRAALLVQLQALSIKGDVSEFSVAQIKKGSGVIDAAQDVLDIIELTRNQAPKKWLFTQLELTQMEKRATDLLARLKPEGSHLTPNYALKAALDAQARVWTLLTYAHAELWAQGAQIYKRDVDDFVPALISRRASKRKARAAEPAPEPVI